MHSKQANITIVTVFLVLGGFLVGEVWSSDSASPASPAREAAPAKEAGQAADLHREIFVMDAHVHMMNRQLHLGGHIGDRYEKAQVDLPRIREGGLDALFFSIYTPEPYYDDRYELKQTLRLMELSLQQLENNDQIELALNASDIERINRQGKTAALLDLEGAYDLDGNLLALQALYRLGLRSLMLPAHNEDSHFADSCCDDHRWGGINEHGRAVIREMNRLGMIINVAHGSTETIVQAAEASEDPILYSHGGYRSLKDYRRNITDEAARAISEKGGVIGLQIGNTFNNASKAYEAYRSSKAYEEYRRQYRQRAANADPSEKTEEPRRPEEGPPASPFEALSRSRADHYPVAPCCPVPSEVRMTVDELIEVIDYAVRLVGEDHVAIGADFGGAVFPPRGIEDIGGYPKITEGLVRKGYSEQRIRKIMGGNLLRLIREVTGK